MAGHAKRNCVFCKWENIKRAEFYRWLDEGNNYYVILSLYPRTDGHTLVISKEPLDDITELDYNNISHMEIVKAVLKWCKILKRKLDVDKVYEMTMCDHWEPNEIRKDWKPGDPHPPTTEHLHIQLIPRYPQMRKVGTAGEHLFVLPEQNRDREQFETIKQKLLS